MNDINAIKQYIAKLQEVREEGTRLNILKPSYAAYMVMAETAAQRALAQAEEKKQ